MTRTLEHWKEIIKQASMLIYSLQKELLKARAESKCAEDRETILKLKLEQETERLWKAQETLNATAKDRAWRAREAFGTAENTVDRRKGMRSAKACRNSLACSFDEQERNGEAE